MLVTLVSLLGVGCRPLTDCNSGVFAGESNVRSHAFDAVDKDGMKVAFVTVGDSYVNKKHYLTDFTITRLTTGEDVSVYISTDKDFSNSLIEQGFWSIHEGIVYDREVTIDINDVPVENTLYFKICNKKSKECTPDHELNFHDAAHDGDAVCYADSVYNYRAVDVTVAQESVTRLSSDVAGVTFERNNTTQKCTLENTSDTAVHLLIEVPARSLVVFESLVYMTAGEKKVEDCKSLAKGDLVTASAWIGYMESVLDRILDKPADIVAEFIWSESATVNITRIIKNEVTTFPINRTQLVDCKIQATYTGIGLESSMESSLYCVNKSSDNVEVRLYLLKEAEVCIDTVCETKWVRDAKVSSIRLDKADDFGDEKVETISVFGVGTYLLDVRTTGWLSNSNLRSVQPFYIYVDGGGLEIVNLNQDVYYEDAPEE